MNPKHRVIKGLQCTVKILKFGSVPEKLAVITLKFEQGGFTIMHPKDDTELQSVDPDQTVPLGSGSALFAKTCLSENLGSLQNIHEHTWTYLHRMSSVVSVAYV